MDAFELLKKDHKKVSQLFTQIESAPERSKAQLFSQLKSELDVHAHIEETFLYPALENKQESRDITLEAYEEHKVVKELLAELAVGAPGDEWNAKLTVLKENVEHHVKEEEGELFDKAENVLSDEQIERLGTDMEAEKGRVQGTPTPRPASSKKAAPSKTGGNTNKKPGVLKRIAEFVGLGDSSGAAKKSRAPVKKTATKKAAAKKKAGGKAKPGSTTRKSASKSTKKSTTKAATKKSASKKTTRSQSGGTRKAATKAGARKKTPSRKK